MSTITFTNQFATPRDEDRVEFLVSALEAPYVEAVVRGEVKEGIDQTIERYGASKALLELFMLSVPLCLGIDSSKLTKADEDTFDKSN